MNMFSRRRFLQSTAGALGAIGLSQLALNRRANQYGRALAQDTTRKVALLVGVNDYSRKRLGGALTDVELQKQLLIHRFGFKPSDVYILPNEQDQATRQNILGYFEEYLYKPAKAGDVVVFHFSGHGDHVLESDLMEPFISRLEEREARTCIDNSNGAQICRNTAIAPFRHDQDGLDAVQNIMGHTLLLMRTALARKTNNVTFILDCCYAGGGKRGNAIMRSLNDSAGNSLGTPSSRISNLEWEYQQSWLERLNMSEDDFIRAIKSPVGPGFFAGAAGAREYAADYSFDGFVAGAFTYVLTQHLWQATSSLSSTISTVSSSLSRLQNHDQTPEYEPDLSAARARSAGADTSLYHIMPMTRPAEAVVLGPKADSDNRFKLWLGGLDPLRLVAFDEGANFSIIDSQTNQLVGEMRQIKGSRQGLIAEGELMSDGAGSNESKQNDSTQIVLQQDETSLSSSLLQEKARGIPDVVVLKIALDDTLIPTEQATVIEVLGETPNFEVFSAEVGKSAHILIGRYTEPIAQQLIPDSTSTLPTPQLNSIGIFSPTQVPIISGSFGAANEPVEQAIRRLRPRLVSLHIGRMLALMVNGEASQIDIDVDVQSAGSRRGTTTRGGNPDAIIIPRQISSSSAEPGIQQIPLNDIVDVTIRNNEDSPLHFGLLAIDAAGDISVLFPVTSDDPNIDIIRGGESKREPLRAIEPLGMVELLILASPQSLVGPLTTLRDKAAEIIEPDRSGPAIFAQEAVSDIFGAMSSDGESATSVKSRASSLHKTDSQLRDGQLDSQSDSQLDSRLGASASEKRAANKRLKNQNDDYQNDTVQQLLDVTEVAVLSMLFEIVPSSKRL